MGGRCTRGTAPTRPGPGGCERSDSLACGLARCRANPQAGEPMQYFFFHLMSWPYLPPDFAAKYDSAWIWLPNALYDPVKGHDLYREYINTLAYADELGFDGVCVNEHHQNAY